MEKRNLANKRTIARRANDFFKERLLKFTIYLQKSNDDPGVNHGDAEQTTCHSRQKKRGNGRKHPVRMRVGGKADISIVWGKSPDSEMAGSGTLIKAAFILPFKNVGQVEPAYSRG